MALARKNSNSKGRSTANKRSSLRVGEAKALRRSSPTRAAQHYAVCVRNDNYPASLELRKLYRVIDDSFADQHALIRVIDESGEDYLYPAAFFVRLELPAALETALTKIA